MAFDEGDNQFDESYQLAECLEEIKRLKNSLAESQAREAVARGLIKGLFYSEATAGGSEKCCPECHAAANIAHDEFCKVGTFLKNPSPAATALLAVVEAAKSAQEIIDPYCDSDPEEKGGATMEECANLILKKSLSTLDKAMKGEAK